MMEIFKGQSSVDLTFFPPLPEPVFQIQGLPCFALKSAAGTRADTLEFLKEENVKWQNCRIQVNSKSRPYFWLSNDICITIHKLCDKFDLSQETKSLAVELFERFFVAHRRELMDLLEAKTWSESTKNRMRRSIESRISKQLLLRLISTVQIASKMNDRDKVVNVVQIREFLVSTDKPYSIESIMASENRVMKALDYKTVYRATETLLALRKSTHLLKCAGQLFAVALEMLSLLYLHHRAIYDMTYGLLQRCEWQPNPEHAHKSSIPCTSAEERSAYLRCELDSLWAGASLLIAAVNVVDPGLQEHLIQELCADLADTRSEHELRTLAYVLVRVFHVELKEAAKLPNSPKTKPGAWLDKIR